MMHTKEPWHNGVYAKGKQLARAIFDEDGHEVAVTDAAETARRIVACVNACAGIETDELELNAPVLDVLDSLRSALAEKTAKVERLEKECEYDQRNAAMSQAESVKAYERIEELERLLKCSVDLENVAHHQLIAERAKVERLREALKKIDRLDCEALAESTGMPVEEFTEGYAGSETVCGVAREALAATAPSAPEASK